MTERLTNLRAIEVSYVIRGVNKKQFLVLKEEEMSKKNAVEHVQSLIGKLTLKNADKIETVLKELAPEDSDAIKAALKVIQALGDKVNPATVQELMALIENPAPAPAEPTLEQMEATPEMKELRAKLVAETARATKAEGEAAAIKKEIADKAVVELFPIKKEADGTDSLDLDKVDEKLRPTLKALWTKDQADKAEMSKIRKELDDSRDARVTKEYEDKAATFADVPVKKEDLAKCLKEIALKAPDAYATVETVLKSAVELAKKAGITKEIGSGQSTEGGNSGADAEYDRIEKAAEEKYKSEAITKEAKTTKFITETDEGRKAYAKYNEERLGKK